MLQQLSQAIKPIDSVTGVNASFPDTSDIRNPLEIAHQFGARFVEIGDRGYAAAEPYHDLIEAWENVIAAPTSSIFVRRGFGYILFQTEKTHERLDDEAFHAWTAGVADSDWDTGLEKLL